MGLEAILCHAAPSGDSNKKTFQLNANKKIKRIKNNNKFIQLKTKKETIVCQAQKIKGYIRESTYPLDQGAAVFSKRYFVNGSSRFSTEKNSL